MRCLAWVRLAGLLAAAYSLAGFATSSALVWTPVTSGVSVRLRGISTVSADVAWASGERGTVLRTEDGGRTWQARPVAGGDALDFRDVEAFDTSTAVAMSIGPGTSSRIYRTEDGGQTWALRYTATDPKMFLDALAFADATHGVAVSDSVDGRFVLLTTGDGGRSWTRVPTDRLPAALPDEGAFAASGTNVALIGRHDVWVGTGASRVLRTPDGGRSWRVTTPPVATGEATGIFSIAFRDTRHGVVVGGNYRRERDAIDNVARTRDGGVTWQRPAHGLSGYRSAVAPLRALGARAWLAVGPTGSDVSLDDGDTWAPAGGDGYDAVSVAPDGRVAYASGAGGRLARLAVR